MNIVFFTVYTKMKKIIWKANYIKVREISVLFFLMILIFFYIVIFN
jgi:hypothetical protein